MISYLAFVIMGILIATSLIINDIMAVCISYVYIPTKKNIISKRNAFTTAEKTILVAPEIISEL